MMEFLAGFLMFLSSLYTGGDGHNNSKAPLNTAIISYSETYFAPVVVEPGNFPRAKRSNTFAAPVAPKIIIESAPAPKPVSPPPPVIVLPPQSIITEDPYVLKTEPIVNWLNANFSFRGTGFEGDRTLPEITFDREYWRIEIFAYWAADVMAPKPVVEKDYFKIEFYEAVTNKLIHTITSEKEESIHKFQSFKKPGKYYFKIYSKSPSQWEIMFTVSSKVVQ